MLFIANEIGIKDSQFSLYSYNLIDIKFNCIGIIKISQ